MERTLVFYIKLGSGGGGGVVSDVVCKNEG